MRIETPPETINFEAAMFGVMVGAIATVAMALIGGVLFLNALLGGVLLAGVVWLVVVLLGRDLPPPQNVAAMGEPQTTDATDTEPGDAMQPKTIVAPADGGDDLEKIKGIGPKLAGALKELGYYRFDQIAAWGPAEIAWIDENLLEFKGRASRDDWVAQAKALAEA